MEVSARCEGLSLLWAWGRLCSLQSGGPEAIRGSSSIQGGGGAQTPCPQAWGGGFALQTCVLASEPNGVRHLVAAGSSAGADATSRTRPREAFPAPAPCPVCCYSRLYRHLGLRGRSLTP